MYNLLVGKNVIGIEFGDEYKIFIDNQLIATGKRKLTMKKRREIILFFATLNEINLNKIKEFLDGI